MARYLRLFGKFFKFSLISQMQYRMNFILLLPMNLTWTLMEVAVVFILYLYTDEIFGWTKYEFILLLGGYFVVDSLFTSVLLPNIVDLSERIRTGQLDFFISKPIDSQFLSFTYRVDLGLIFAFTEGVFFIVFSLINLNISINPLQIFLYVLLLVNGAIIFASITFILASFAFRTIQVDYVNNLFAIFAQFSRKPFDIYPKYLKYFTIYALPVGFIAYVPTGFLLNKLGYIWTLSFVFSIILFIISRKVWNSAVKSYSSASS